MSTTKLEEELSASDSADAMLLYFAFCLVASGMIDSGCKDNEDNMLITFRSINKQLAISKNNISKDELLSWLHVLLPECDNNTFVQVMVQIVLNIITTKTSDMYMNLCRKELKNRYMRNQFNDVLKMFAFKKDDNSRIIDYMIMLTSCGTNVMHRMIDNVLRKK